MEHAASQKQAACWACGTPVLVPCHNGMYAQTYKCGMCGAITEGGLPKHQARAPVIFRVSHGVRQLFVCLICLILLSVPAAGFTCVLPQLLSGPLLALNIAWSAFLAVNIYFNYAAAILRHPGPVELKTGKDAAVAAGCFDNCVLCVPCQAPKPVLAHHCSRCRTCVMEMDHHCIFLNSCVGLNNMRHFLLMLLYLIAGCAYTLVACVTLMWQERDAVKADWGRLLAPVLRTGHFWELFLITPRFLLTAPWWLAGTTYLAALTAGAVPGILLLIILELRLIFRGQSYIESLQGRSANGTPLKETALRRVFGCGRLVFWPAMRWHPPPGSAAAAQLHTKKST